MADLESIEAPAREEVTPHRCRCLILMWTEGGRKVKDRCNVQIDSPDQPFCRVCEDRHPEDQLQERTEVTAVLVDG